MSAPHPAPDPDPDEDASRSRAQRQLERLDELADLGIEVARGLARQASEPQAESRFGGDIALAYSRVARAVRMTVLLQSKLTQDIALQAKAAAVAGADAQVTADNARFHEAYVRKARVERIVGRLSQARHGDDEDAIDRELIEAGQRLDDEDLYGDLLERPLSELVARICRDLGLDPDWSALSQELWAQDEIAGGETGAPLLAALERVPLPVDGGGESARRSRALERSGGDGSAAVRRAGHPHPHPFPHEGGRETPHAASP